MHIRYEIVDSQQGAIGTKLAMTISYPTNTSGIIVLLKMSFKIKIINNKNKNALKKYVCLHLWSMT